MLARVSVLLGRVDAEGNRNRGPLFFFEVSMRPEEADVERDLLAADAEAIRRVQKPRESRAPPRIAKPPKRRSPPPWKLLPLYPLTATACAAQLPASYLTLPVVTTGRLTSSSETGGASVVSTKSPPAVKLFNGEAMTLDIDPVHGVADAVDANARLPLMANQLETDVHRVALARLAFEVIDHKWRRRRKDGDEPGGVGIKPDARVGLEGTRSL